MSQTPLPSTVFEIRVPKSSETSPEAMSACIKALPKMNNSLLDWLLKQERAISLELVAWNQRIYFLAAVPTTVASYFHSQLTAQYPQALITTVGDYLPFFFPKESTLSEKQKMSKFGQLCLSRPFYLPLKTYQDFKDIDPLSTVLGTIAKSDPADKIAIQFLITAPPHNWQDRGSRVAHSTIPTGDPEKTMPHPQKSLIEQKIAQIGLKVGINLLVVSPRPLQAEVALSNLAGSFASFTHGEGNSLSIRKPFMWQQNSFFESILARRPAFTPRSQVLTAEELASLYHLPNQLLVNIRNIAWGGTLKGEPPENLPTPHSLSEDQKREVNFLAKTEFKNQSTVFGIKREDRRKHIYIIGKTGVGKSTLIANMAINDMRNGEGLAIIDPHGDLCNTVLDYIPSFRMNDVVYLDPNNTQAPFRLNPLQVEDQAQADLIASGIVAIFHKLFAHSWGPRLEYILRNTLFTLAQIPGSTLLDVPKILTDTEFLNRVLGKLNDQTLKQFWTQEFLKLDAKARTEAISPILNKVGQFITSPKLRAILERPHSSINLGEIMNGGKILLLNLSQGKIGEDNAALLGAMIITQMQLAAMNRVLIPESERRDFYLYVDEFQNFATDSFIKILSEARKYRLNLTLANQYIDQVSEDIQKAIFGNVGTLVSFLVGSRDAQLLKTEFGNLYEDADLVELDNFEVVIKLSIDNRTSSPFPAKTLALPFSKNQHRDTVIQISQERYGRKQSQNLQAIEAELANPNLSATPIYVNPASRDQKKELSMINPPAGGQSSNNTEILFPIAGLNSESQSNGLNSQLTPAPPRPHYTPGRTDNQRPPYMRRKESQPRFKPRYRPHQSPPVQTSSSSF